MTSFVLVWMMMTLAVMSTSASLSNHATHQRPLRKSGWGRVLTAEDKDSSFIVEIVAILDDGIQIADPGCLISER
ncbi:unnamed protein product [Notodromas monacha]|uniref:Secreted protein n=1 Tax=Notodromas monacha TaxID=399045 RepID=A0A7R9GJQ5_9CRUS|nr:unnamed protein product [Notodromas monacha]CAG0925110.1 unnamed protein product [Notodromas monacha]